LAELAHETPGDGDGATVYGFRNGSVSVDLSVLHRREGLRLRVRCASLRGGILEVLHGGATVNENLDSSGTAEVDIEPGLLSVFIQSDGQDVPPVQTMWIQIR
jgi:hypothetical protein